MIDVGGRLWPWWLPVASLMLLGSAWAIGMPLHAVPDELDHVDRAAAVARGQVVASPGAVVNGTGGLVIAPEIFRSLGAANSCFAGHPEVPADCLAPPAATARPTPVASGAARYFPVYYFIVGLPSLIFANALGWYLMRLVSLAVNALLLGGAFASASTFVRAPLVRLGVLCALTPMAVFLDAGVNPSSWEISGAIGVWTTGLAILFAPPSAVAMRTLLRQMAFSALAMVTSRGLSPLWLALIAVALALTVGVSRWRALLAARGIRSVAAAVLVAVVVVVAWNQWQSTLEIGHNAQGQYGLLHRLAEPVHLLTFRLQQMIGVFSWLDTPAPALVYVVWTAVVGALALAAAAAGRHRLLAALALTAALTIAVPNLIEAATANQFGFVWQGRYTLPLAVGIPVLAATTVALDAELRPSATLRLAAVSALLLAAAQLAALWTVLVRFESGLGVTLNPLAGSWHPPIGALPVLVMAAVGLGGLVLTVIGSEEAPLLG